MDSNGHFFISENRPEGLELKDPKEEVANDYLPFNIIISIRRMGWVEFDFSGWDRTKAIPMRDNGDPIDFDAEWVVTKLRLNIMNMFLSIFYTHYEQIHKVNLPKKVITSKDQITRTDLESPNVGFGSNQGLRLTSEPMQGIAIWVVPDVIKKTIEDLKAMLFSNEKFWGLIENIAVAHLNHQNNHFSQSVAISWTSIEAILIFMWDQYIVPLGSENAFKESVKRNNNNRYQGDSSRKYSSQVIIDVLADFLKIDITKKEKLHSIRSERNNWVHDLKDIDMLISHDALNMAINLLNSLIPIKLSWNANTSWYSG